MLSLSEFFRKLHQPDSSPGSNITDACIVRKIRCDPRV